MRLHRRMQVLLIAVSQERIDLGLESIGFLSIVLVMMLGLLELGRLNPNFARRAGQLRNRLPRKVWQVCHALIVQQGN